MTTLKTVQRNEVPPPHQAAVAEESSLDVMLEPVARMYCPVCNQKMNTSSVKAFSTGRCPSCGENVVVHGKIGAYRVLRVLGQGGMGIVYEGYDEGLGRKVAIKVTQIDVTQDKEMLATFKREAQIVARLNHPNVVQVYAFGEEKGHPYLVMELLSSGSLMDLIKETEPIGEAFLMGVAFEIAEGLNAAQDAGLLHGDIKPENILFDEKMRAKLVDFGIAAMQVSKDSHEVWGTPYYIAPEKVLERKSNHKGDIYSLGATLYHAVAKNPPFNGTDPTVVIKAAIKGDAPPLSTIRPNINPEVEAIISRMMEKDVALRYPNYKSIIADIKKYLASVPRDRLRRTSRIVVSTSKKIKAGTQNLLIPKGAPTSSITTASQPLQSVLPDQTKCFFKTCYPKILLLAGCLALIAGVMCHKCNCKRDEPNTLYLQAWTVDKQYVKEFGAMEDSLKDLEELCNEAQRTMKSLQARAVTGEGVTPNGEGLKKDEDFGDYQKKFEGLLQDAVALRNQAEIAKLEPFNREEIDAQYVSRLEKGLESQKTYATSIERNATEAERLLSEMMSKMALFDPASTNSQTLAQMAQNLKATKELASGAGKDAMTIDLGKEKGLQNFKMQNGESLIIAMWNPQPGMEGGGEVKPLLITRTDGAKAYFSHTSWITALGLVSFKGISKRSRFPVIEKVESGQPGSNAEEYLVPKMEGLSFRLDKATGIWRLHAAGVRRKIAAGRMESAPALVVKVNRDDTYSMTGQLVLRASDPEANILWMVWTAKLD